MLLLDSDILIDILRGHGPATQWFAGLSNLPAVPGFVVMELIQDADNKDRVEKARKLVAPLEVAWPGGADCENALSCFSQYHLSHGLGLLDALIGSTAVGRAATLCTFNSKHYRVVPGIDLLQPYQR